MPSNKETDKADSPAQDRAPGTHSLDEVIGAAVKMRRMQLGLSLDDVCDRINAETTLNWPPATMSRIEAGKRKIRVGEMGILCAVLQASLTNLMDSKAKLGDGLEGWTPRGLAGFMVLDYEEIEREVNLDLAMQRRAERLNEELRGHIMKSLDIQPVVQDDEAGKARFGGEWFDSLVFRQYGQNLYDEREARVEGQIFQWQQQGATYPEGVEKQLRADATRNMIAELREAMRAGE